MHHLAPVALCCYHVSVMQCFLVAMVLKNHVNICLEKIHVHTVPSLLTLLSSRVSLKQKRQTWKGRDKDPLKQNNHKPATDGGGRPLN